MSTTTAVLERYLEQHEGDLQPIIDRFGLPLHVVFLAEVAGNVDSFRTVLNTQYPHGLVAFAVKSNPCRGAVRAVSRLGLGADVASENELRLALEEGIAPTDIICNGNAKSDRYLRDAVAAGCLIAVDNEDELRSLERIAGERNRTASILLRFRGMPLAGLTSADQSTAADWTKFGFHVSEASSLFERLSDRAQLRLRGVSAHIGTQIARPEGYWRLFDYMIGLCESSQAMDHAFDILDLGGGYPVAFLTKAQWAQFRDALRARLASSSGEAPSVTWNDLPMGYGHLESQADAPEWIGKAYWSAHPAGGMLEALLGHRNANGVSNRDRLQALGSPRLIVEPGRSLFASAGVTLTEVTGTKSVLGHRVVALDMGINNHGTNLITPDIFPAAVWPRRAGDEPIEAFLAGRLCFSGDMISKAKIELNRQPTPGERFVLFHTGAYGADHFASRSCGFLIPPKVAVRTDGRIEIWREPERFEDVFGSAADELTMD